MEIEPALSLLEGRGRYFRYDSYNKSYMKYLPTRRSKMADITEDINFDDLCSTCEQMELDVSEV